jgi:hypothetical protein
MGTVTWLVNVGVNTDGEDIFSGAFKSGTDVFGDAAFNDITNTVVFRTATVNAVPEPGALLLLGVGALGLLVAGRRGRS